MASKLDPLSEEAFDGEKFKTEINSPKCLHEWKLIGTQEMRCNKCGFGLTGDVLPLHKSIKT